MSALMTASVIRGRRGFRTLSGLFLIGIGTLLLYLGGYCGRSTINEPHDRADKILAVIGVIFIIGGIIAEWTLPI